MALRQVEIIVARDEYEKAMETIDKVASEDDLTWVSILKDGKVSVITIVDMENIESLTDDMEKRFHISSGYRIIIHQVEAVLPRIVDNDTDDKKKTKAKKTTRLSREELYAQAQDMCQFSKPTAALIVFSTIVAVIGLRINSEVLTLAAMIIAPLVGPNVALALSTTLGDKELARKSIVSASKGIALAAIVSLALGFIIQIDSCNEAIQRRVHLDLYVVVLALVSGAAGVVSFISGASSSLVGVMISLSILPPLVASALLFSHGLFTEGSSAAIMFLVNIISLNLAGVATFVVSGVQPMSWWEAKRARILTLKAVSVWIVLLIVMVGIIYFNIYNYKF